MPVELRARRRRLPSSRSISSRLSVFSDTQILRHDCVFKATDYKPTDYKYHCWMAKGVVLEFVDGVIEVHFNFDRALIADLKALQIGAAWNPELRRWAFPYSSEALGKLLDRLEELGYRIGLTEDRWLYPPGDDEHTWIGQAVESVGPALAPRLMKALAMVLHPDHGGDSEAMIELNRLRDEYQR